MSNFTVTNVEPLLFAVNSLSDAADANPGDGVADIDLTQPGLQTTLRAAIAEANASAGAAIVDLTQVSGTLTLASALPVISDALSLIGAGAENLTISGNTATQLLFVDNSTVYLSGVTIANGKAKGGNGSLGSSGGGGAAGLGGAVFVNGGDVTFDGVVFNNNHSIGGAGGNGGTGGGGGGGGGIGANGNSGFYVGGTGGAGGGFGGNGGSGGTSTAMGGGNGGAGGVGAGGGGGGFGYGQTGGMGASGGFGGGGGGGGYSGGNSSVGGSGGNGGFGGGGGGAANQSASGGAGGSFAGNGASTTTIGGGGGGAGLGGALFVNAGTVNLIQTSFVNNGATGGSGGTGAIAGAAGQGKGGAIFVRQGATVNALGSTPTFSNNSAGQDANQPTDNDNIYGAIAVLPLPTVTVVAPVTSTKEGSTANVTYQINRSHAIGNLTVYLTLGGTANTSDYSITGAGVATDNTVVSITIPHGEATASLTIAPQNDIHAEADETLILSLQADDAYLLGAAQQAILTIDANDTVVTNTNDSGEGSLRQAVLNANAGLGTDAITFTEMFADATPDLIALTSGELTLTGDTSIVGTGAQLLTIDGGGTSNIFDIQPEAAVEISALTIADGQAVKGGGILNQGVLTLSGAVLQENSASSDGGAIFNGGSLTITETLVQDNTADNLGGAIYNSGDLTIANAGLDSNTASQSGGAVYNAVGATATIANSTVANNTGQVDGVSIYNSGTLDLINSTVISPVNSPSSSGIFNDGNLTVTTGSSTLTNPIYGYAGNDQLLGGADNDQLVGGAGDDNLTGGFGIDRFVYQSLADGSDTITDFSSNEDLLDLSPLFASLEYTGSDPIADGYLIIQASNQDTLIYASSTGSGQYPELLATLSSVSPDDLAVGKNILVAVPTIDYGSPI